MNSPPRRSIARLFVALKRGASILGLASVSACATPRPPTPPMTPSATPPAQGGVGAFANSEARPSLCDCSQCSADRSADLAEWRAGTVGVVSTVVADRLERAAASMQADTANLSALVPKWRPSIDGYAPIITQSPSQSAASSAYLTTLHRQVHVVYTSGFLAGLSSFPRGHSLNACLATQVEIVIQTNGALDRLGVVASSGIVEFDAGVLESIARAAPFEPPPAALTSADGVAYLHWTFHRDDEGCAPGKAAFYR